MGNYWIAAFQNDRQSKKIGFSKFHTGLICIVCYGSKCCIFSIENHRELWWITTSLCYVSSVYRNRQRSASSGDPCAKFPVRPETRRSSSVGAVICGNATRPDFMVSSPTWALAEICGQERIQKSNGHVSSPPTTPFGLPGEAVHFFFPVRCGWVGSLILPGATIQHVTQIPIFILHHFICWLMFPLRQLHLLDCRVKQSISSSPLQITRAASTSIFLQAVSDPTLLCW